MSQSELLKRVVAVLDAAGIDYMVTGSVASSLHGEPRASHDIDRVVSLPITAVGTLLAAFPAPEYYLAEEAMRDAIRNRFMFNLLALDSGDKVDFWVLTEEPFDRARFSRKVTQEYQGTMLKASSPEDTILAKLRWAQMSGGSEKQMTDALRVYELQREKLDTEYLSRWAVQLGVEDLWLGLQSQAAAE